MKSEAASTPNRRIEAPRSPGGGKKIWHQAFSSQEATTCLMLAGGLSDDRQRREAANWPRFSDSIVEPHRIGDARPNHLGAATSCRGKMLLSRSWDGPQRGRHDRTNMSAAAMRKFPIKSTRSLRYQETFVKTCRQRRRPSEMLYGSTKPGILHLHGTT